jgi:cyanophycinase
MAGTLVIIGGREDREGDKVVLREVARRADRRRVVVVGTASGEPEELFDTYRRAFADLGVKDVVPLDVRTREQALEEAAAEPLRHAGAVFLTGGDQLRLTSQLGGTPVLDAIRKVYQDGGVIAGTSAGASVQSDTMMVSGEGESAPKLGEALRLAPGFGLLPGVIIDQHFAARGRMGRLLAAVAQNPASLGLGIDEDTAVVVERSRFRVVGRGGVYVFDAAKATFSNVAEADPDETLSVHDVTLHALRAGDRFDLNPRRPFRPPGGEE